MIIRYAIKTDEGFKSTRDDLNNWVLWMFDTKKEAEKYCLQGEKVVPIKMQTKY